MSLSKYKNMIFDLLYIYFSVTKKKGGDYVINLELKKEDENSYFNFFLTDQIISEDENSYFNFFNRSNYIRNIAVFLRNFNVDYVISGSLVKETKAVSSNKYLSGNQQYHYFPAPDLTFMSCSEFSPIH